MDLWLRNCVFRKKRKFTKKDDILKFLANSNYITNEHLSNLKQTAINKNLDADKVLYETDPTKLMEGIYIKVEENGVVVNRVKFVRASYKQQISEPENWHARKIITNMLKSDN
jgi:hypothetical protein